MTPWQIRKGYGKWPLWRGILKNKSLLREKGRSTLNRGKAQKDFEAKELGLEGKLQDWNGWSFMTRGQNEMRSETNQKLNSIDYITKSFFFFLIMVRLVPSFLVPSFLF